MPMINVFGSKVGQEEIDAIAGSLKAQWLGMGPKVAAFEKGFAAHGNLDHFLMVDSGSNALYMAVTLLNLPKGSEVIVPTFTWVSCAQAVLLAGCTPVMADVDLATMNVTAETVKAQITDKTAAIMVVHYAGLPVLMEEILALGYPVIEDAAHAVDSFHNGKLCGSMGDVGIYSFDAVKNLAVGEGGGLTTRYPDMAARAKKLRYCGIEKSGFEASKHGKKRWWEYSITEPFIKMNPSDIAGAMGVAQLEKLPDLQARRKEIWERYQAELADVDWIICPKDAPEGDTHSYFTYALRVTNGKRDDLAAALFDQEIYTTLRYHPLHLNPLYGQMDKRLPNAEALNEDCLSIPLHPNLSDEDVTRIIAALKAFA
ncbi:MAG: DegT/DnrJ/EryC1/StrS family aminotransferase [Alphaproteobacteria bacterium CG_4_10_14_0_8_um_filter_53_9]|nr:MAG: DegT/DnrJ/EryC1/StrS family aminotransferase [Alphaproteobacteria bacterium CG_4_10_14_0_8_um_filter_53_9]